MADHLILSSLQPSPFLIIPCSLRRRWRFPGGIRFSVPEFRLSSSQLQLANSASSSQSSSSSSSDKFDIVSTTQLKDGSHVFRFGDASEIERNLDIEEKSKKQHAKIRGKVSDVSKKQGIKEEEEEEGAGLSSVIKIKDRKRVRSPTKKKKDTLNVSHSEDKVASVTSLSSVVSVAEAVLSSSTEEKVDVSEKPEPIDENEISVDSETVEEQVSVNELSDSVPNGYQQISENRVEVEAKVDVSEKSEPINENEISVNSETVEPLSLEVVEEVSVNEVSETQPNGYQKITENRVEVEASPRLSTSQNDSRSEDLKEVDAHASTIELVDTLDVRETVTKTFEAEENLVVEPTATASVSPDEPTATASVSPDEPTATASVSPDEHISRREATDHSIDEITETPVIDTSEVANDGENVASIIEDEITAMDIQADNGTISTTVNHTTGEDAPETGLESIEVASGREEVVSKAFFLDSGLASLQSPFEALAGREDAYFISHHNWLGVADGVSQWSFEGINKGTYAQELMSNCQKITSNESAEIADPVQVLHRSVNETKSPGSSTALVAHLNNNELHIANIGDSGFTVIRNGTVVQRSSPMFHHFWYPLHVTQGNDVRKLAEVYNVNLEEGDVIITATDGLFDNLYDKEIVSIVCRSLEQNLEPQKIAELMAAKAQEVGGSGADKTPFADAAKEEGYDGYRGGKLDAVTVIVSLVKTVSI